MKEEMNILLIIDFDKIYTEELDKELAKYLNSFDSSVSYISNGDVPENTMNQLLFNDNVYYKNNGECIIDYINKEEDLSLYDNIILVGFNLKDYIIRLRKLGFDNIQLLPQFSDSDYKEIL